MQPNWGAWHLAWPHISSKSQDIWPLGEVLPCKTGLSTTSWGCFKTKISDQTGQRTTVCPASVLWHLAWSPFDGHLETRVTTRQQSSNWLDSWLITNAFALVTHRRSRDMTNFDIPIIFVFKWFFIIYAEPIEVKIWGSFDVKGRVRCGRHDQVYILLIRLTS